MRQYLRAILFVLIMISIGFHEGVFAEEEKDFNDNVLIAELEFLQAMQIVNNDQFEEVKKDEEESHE